MSVLFALLSLVGTMLLSIFGRDLYACLPRLQKLLLRIAASQLPPEVREAHVEMWQADLDNLWPLELWRTLVALDNIRAGYTLGKHLRAIRNRAYFWERLSVRLGMMLADLVCFAIIDAVLHIVTRPPALAFVSDHAKEQPNLQIDFMLIIAVTFLIANNIAGVYNANRALRANALSVPWSSILPAGSAGLMYVFLMNQLSPKATVASALVWCVMVIIVPFGRMGMCRFLGRLGIGRRFYEDGQS